MVGFEITARHILCDCCVFVVCFECFVVLSEKFFVSLRWIGFYENKIDGVSIVLEMEETGSGRHNGLYRRSRRIRNTSGEVVRVSCAGIVKN